MTTRKVVMITGGNTGIGFETVKAFLQSPKPYHILMGSRSLDKANAAIATLKEEVPETKSIVEAVQVDLRSDESIEKVYQQVKSSPGRLDILINNAGLALDGQALAGKVSLRESFSSVYDTNVSGTHVLTHTFVPLLLKSDDPRLIFVAGLANITTAAEKYFPTPPLPKGWPKPEFFETIGYRCSKVALNMLMLDWNHKLKEDGVKVWAVGPGFLLTSLGGMPETTEMAKKMGAGHPSAGGDILRKVAEGERDADVGKVINKDGISAL